MANRLTIIGTVPPPLGGVRIHVMRLLDMLAAKGVDHEFIMLSTRNLAGKFREILRSGIIHLHTSNSWLQLGFSIFSAVTRKNIIITYHGNLERYGFLRRKAVQFSIRLAKVPVVLNRRSLEVALRLNPRSRLLSVFLPPRGEISNQEVIEKVSNFRKKYMISYCTNASTLSYDERNREIYGITDLISIFNDRKDECLVISDPSSRYRDHILKNGIRVNDNIMIISESHSFPDVLKNTDCMIRNTSTDGDSISVREALFFKRRVICSDCVDRPDGCIIYPAGDMERLRELLDSPSTLAADGGTDAGDGAGDFERLLDIYNEFIST